MAEIAYPKRFTPGRSKEAGKKEYGNLYEINECCKF